MEEFEYSFAYIKGHGFFWIVLRGALTPVNLLVAHEEFRRDPEYTPHVDELIDLTGANFNGIGRREFYQIRRALLDTPDRHGNRSVIVVGSQLAYGLSRMFGAVVEAEVPVDRHVCYTIQEALEWLRPDDCESILALYPEYAPRLEVHRTLPHRT